MKSAIALGLLVLISLAGLASSKKPVPEASSTTPATLQTRSLMGQYLTQMTLLKRFFVSEEKFTAPENTAEISEHLKELARLSKEAAHDPVLSSESYKFSRQVLEDHIADTERVFRLGNKSYARWQLASTLSVCMSCHTQVPMMSKTFGEFKGMKMFSSDFDQAEFLFAIRDFDRAMSYYDKVIDGFPANHVSTDQVEKSLQRQVAYFSRVKRAPADGIAKMKLHQKNKELPEYLRLNTKAWVSQFEEWKKQTAFDPRTATDKQILEFAKQNIESHWTPAMLDAIDPTLVNYLRVSGILYEYLQTHPHTQAEAQILYWLAICDRSINNNFFYSLADMYLKECITRFPADPIAKKCYDEYETQTLLGYTGSSGVHLPPEVKEQLKSLKEWVQSKGQVELRKK